MIRQTDAEREAHYKRLTELEDEFNPKFKAMGFEHMTPLREPWHEPRWFHRKAGTSVQISTKRLPFPKSGNVFVLRLESYSQRRALNLGLDKIDRVWQAVKADLQRKKDQEEAESKKEKAMAAAKAEAKRVFGTIAEIDAIDEGVSEISVRLKAKSGLNLVVRVHIYSMTISGVEIRFYGMKESPALKDLPAVLGVF